MLKISHSFIFFNNKYHIQVTDIRHPAAGFFHTLPFGHE